MYDSPTGARETAAYYGCGFAPPFYCASNTSDSLFSGSSLKTRRLPVRELAGSSGGVEARAPGGSETGGDQTQRQLAARGKAWRRSAPSQPADGAESLAALPLSARS